MDTHELDGFSKRPSFDASFGGFSAGEVVVTEVNDAG
jgi:hypothetical protein